jgi:hypothetical protein
VKSANIGDRASAFDRTISGMHAKVVPELSTLDLILPILIAGVFILLVSLIREPARQRFMTVFVAGAGAAYLNGGLGLWEFAFTALVTYCAYRGFDSYGFIAAGWLLHTAWDVVHHLYGSPIVFFSPTSSAGCAIADTLIAVWCLLGAPSLVSALRGRGDKPHFAPGP